MRCFLEEACSFYCTVSRRTGTEPPERMSMHAARSLSSHRQCIQVAMLFAGCDGGQHTVDQHTAAGCCAGRMPRIADACSSCGLDTEKCGRRCSSTDAVSGQDGLAAILRRCAARRYGRVCCCCCLFVSRRLRFIGRGKKPLTHTSPLPLSSFRLPQAKLGFTPTSGPGVFAPCRVVYLCGVVCAHMGGLGEKKVTFDTLAVGPAGGED